jgi:hypothetical protein
MTLVDRLSSIDMIAEAISDEIRKTLARGCDRGECTSIRERAHELADLARRLDLDARLEGDLVLAARARARAEQLHALASGDVLTWVDHVASVPTRCRPN